MNFASRTLVAIFYEFRIGLASRPHAGRHEFCDDFDVRCKTISHLHARAYIVYPAKVLQRRRRVILHNSAGKLESETALTLP